MTPNPHCWRFLTALLDEQERALVAPCTAAGIDAGGDDSTCGVGLLLDRKATGLYEWVEVMGMLPGGPAEQSGQVAAGDVLVAVRDEDAHEASRDRP